MGQWLIMKTRGFLRDHLLYLRILTICTVLSTGSLILNQAKPTSEESISGKNANLEIVVILENGEELRVKATGKATTEVLTNLKQMLNSMAGNLLVEKSYQSTKHQDV